MSALQSELLSSVPGIRHGFGTRKANVPAPWTETWESLRWRGTQVHGTHCAELLGKGQGVGEADGVFTRLPGVPASVMSADCVPILLARRDGKAVAAVHAGWRGTRARILVKLWEQLFLKGEEPRHWVAAVGPSIGPCCYEVSPEIAQDFATNFSTYGVERVVPRERHLDLGALNELELKSMGIHAVDRLTACTRCTLGQGQEHLLHSYRREGSGTRQYSVIAIQR